MFEMLIGKNSNAGGGYFISQGDFLTHNSLFSKTGMNSGTPINTDCGWLVFNNGKLIMSQKAIRSRFTWDTLNSLGMVFGTKIINVNGYSYKVRLLTGATTDPGTVAGGEFNFYINQLASSRPSDYEGEVIDNLSDTFFGLDPVLDPKGRSNYCQETFDDGSVKHCVSRGYAGVQGIGKSQKNFSNDNSGWRPVLELVS